MGLLLAFLVFTLSLIAPPYVLALKKRAPKKAGTTSGVSYSSARLSRGTNSVILSLTNLTKVTRVTYELSYSANGKAEGVGGSLSPSGQTNESRDLYFGTCSSGVCTAHRNIKNATLTVGTTLKNGQKYSKRYRMKV